MRIARGSEKIRLLRHRQASEAGRKKRSDALLPSVHVDRRRITLQKLRFMGEEPDERYASGGE